ncbi:MAG: FAD-dependent oxidoreductase [Gammaproteobacteria bacterium HGW-Gammaproteobacteria-8]|nr:MAG: FAD-dependent oxidoreductase [Gammaproteobacteria bacterium HGW-Gammaproteobacteria-8]
MHMNPDVIVIGAGWSGLTAAARMREAGLRVLVLEKSRGPGGRSATRRAEAAQFDHGAQYFTARSGAFGRQLQQWRDAGLVAPWRPRLAVLGGHDGHRDPDATSRYVAVPGMNAICRHLAAELDCRYQAEVESLHHDQGWIVTLTSGELLQAPRLLLTAPPQQAARLLGADDRLHEMLAGVEFAPTLAAMLQFTEPLDPGFDAAFVNGDSALSWVACDSSKPGRSGACWVLHAGPDWSSANLELPPDQIGARLQEAFAALLEQALPELKLLLGHRWRYALAVAPGQQGFQADPDRSLAIAGDWLSGSRVEGAWTSGRKAGEWLAQAV